MATIDKQISLFKRIANSYDNFKKTGQTNMTKGACLARMTQLEQVWYTFDKNHNALCEDEEVDTADVYFKDDLYSKAEEAYLNKLGLFRDYLLTLEGMQQSSTASTQASTSNQSDEMYTQARLPEVSIPTFSGEIKDWVRFKDTFTEMIVKRPNLPNVFKMHYLKNALTGEAASLLEEIPEGGDNFSAAWEMLKEYYNNNRLLITKLLSKLFSLTGMQSITAQEVSRVKSTVKNILQALKVLGSPIEHWDHVVVFLVVSRLSVPIQRKWEEYVAKSDNPQQPPSFDSLDKFLETERLALLQLESAKQGLSQKNDSRFRDRPGFNTNKEKGANSKNSNTQSVHLAQEEKKAPSCSVCNGAHSTFKCENFVSKPIAERRKLTVEKHLCFNCLAKHLVQNCRSEKRCRQCNGRHHTLLHQNFSSQNGKNNRNSAKENLDKAEPSVSETKQGETAHTAVILTQSNEKIDSVLLATAWIHVVSTDGSEHLARALIDQGAQSSFISEDLCKILRLRRLPVQVPISGVGSDRKLTCKSKVEFRVRPHFVSTFSLGITAYVIPKNYDI